MSLLRGAALFALILLSSAAAAAAQSPQVESTPIPTPPKPDFAPMMFMTGTWNCSVMSSRRPGPYQVTSTASVDPTGYWLVTRSVAHKASWFPADLVSEDRMTYDPSTSRWIDISTDNGGGYNVSTSPGWQGNQIVWTDAVITKSNNTASTSPTTMTKDSGSRTTSVSSFTEPGGRVVNVRTTCTKS